MKALSVGMVLLVFSSAACEDKTSKFTGKWLAQDDILSPIIIGQQAGKMTCIIDSVKRLAEYDAADDQLIAKYEKAKGCFRFTATCRIKYLPGANEIAMIRDTIYGETPPKWNRYSRQ